MPSRIITEEEFGEINSILGVIAQQRLAIIEAQHNHVTASVKLRESGRNLELIYNKLCDVCAGMEKRRIESESESPKRNRRKDDA